MAEMKLCHPEYEMTPMDQLLANACTISKDENYMMCLIETCCVNWRISAELVGQFIDDDNPKNNKFQFEVLEMKVVES